MVCAASKNWSIGQWQKPASIGRTKACGLHILRCPRLVDSGFSFALTSADADQTDSARLRESWHVNPSGRRLPAFVGIACDLPVGSALTDLSMSQGMGSRPTHNRTTIQGNLSKSSRQRLTLTTWPSRSTRHVANQLSSEEPLRYLQGRACPSWRGLGKVCVRKQERAA